MVTLQECIDVQATPHAVEPEAAVDVTDDLCEQLGCELIECVHNAESCAQLKQVATLYQAFLLAREATAARH